MQEKMEADKDARTDTFSRIARVERDAYYRLMASALADRDIRTHLRFMPLSKERKKSAESEKTELIKELQKANIDPLLFDSLLSNETNRRLKVKFGIAFLTLTFLFTAISYAIVVFNGFYSWHISDAAITGLIIETPIQFVGLLYIIARNLFPSREQAENKEQSR